MPRSRERPTPRIVIPILVAATMAGCLSAPRRTAPPSVVPPQSDSSQPAQQSPGTNTVEAYAAAIKANAQKSDHESDSRIRADLAAQSSSAADACLALDSRAVACQYGKAVATGLEARVHPTRAIGLLNSMLESLDNAEAVDPNYDSAGPARVRALVLIRAPGWPLGPGDTDAGLAAARRAVSLQPDYPPNVLALAEALAKSGDESAARESYSRARDLAQASPPAPERDDWLHDADEGLRRK